MITEFDTVHCHRLSGKFSDEYRTLVLAPKSPHPTRKAIVPACYHRSHPSVHRRNASRLPTDTPQQQKKPENRLLLDLQNHFSVRGKGKYLSSRICFTPTHLSLTRSASCRCRCVVVVVAVLADRIVVMWLNPDESPVCLSDDPAPPPQSSSAFGEVADPGSAINPAVSRGESLVRKRVG